MNCPKCNAYFKPEYLSRFDVPWAVKLTKAGKTACPVCGHVCKKVESHSTSDNVKGGER